MTQGKPIRTRSRDVMTNRRIITGAALVALVLASGLSAAVAQSNVQRNEAASGTNSANAPDPVMPMGILYTNLAAVAGIAGTSEQTLATFSLPAGTLDHAGRHLRITADFTKLANTDSVIPKLYFGSEALATAANTTSAGAMKIQCDVVKTGASTQQVDCWGLGGTAGVTPVIYSAAGAETDT